MLKGPIARATIRTSFVLGLRLVVQAGTLLLVARMLGPEQFGAFAGVAALAVLLGALSTFGTNLVLFGEVSKDPARRTQVLPYIIPTTLLCGGALLVFYLLLSFWLLQHSGLSLAVLTAIGFTEILLQPLFGLMATEHHALERVARAQLLQNLPLALRLLAAACIITLHLPQAMLLYTAGYLLASILALWFASLYLPERWPCWRQWRLPSRQELVNTFGYAVLNITKTGPTELDKTIALKLLPLEAAGLYTASARVIGAITLPITAMTLSALPRLFRVEGSKKHSGTKQLLVWMYGAAFFYSLILAAVLWLAAPLLARIFGSEYHGMIEIIRLLCLAIPAISLRLVAGNALMALGKPWMRVSFETIGLSTLAIFSIIFVPSIGIKGMPIAMASTEWGMAIMGYLLLKSLQNKGTIY